ncbi:MAG: peptidoglycan recognition family protein [Candidatus Dojkabacteria bacterium]
MENNKEKIIVGLSTFLVLFSAGLISYSGIIVLSNNAKVPQANDVSTNSNFNTQVLGAAAVSSNPVNRPINQTTNPRTTSPTGPTTQQPLITQSSQYINATRTPLEEIKPKNFYFTSSTSDISQYRFRVKYFDGTFSDFTKIEALENLKGDSAILVKVSIIYIFDQNYTDIEIENNPGDISVIFINDPNNTLTSSAYNVAYDYEKEYKKALFANFGINLVTREEWGAPSYSEWIPEFAKVNRIVIHHTATSVDMNNPGNTVKAIYNDHKIRCSDNSGYYPANCSIENTWSDIGYNYLIDPYGNIFEGRSGGNGVIGAHAIPNSGSIGISLLGNYSTSAPSQAMLTSLTKLTGALSFLNDFRVVWQTSLFGHRDYLNTECPGNNVYNLLPQLAINAENMRESYGVVTPNRNLIGKLSFGQDFIRGNPSITADGTSYIYLITDNISQSMKDKLKSTSNWSGTYGTEIHGDNVVAFVPVDLAPTFVGELGLAIPNLQFSTDLP